MAAVDGAELGFEDGDVEALADGGQGVGVGGIGGEGAGEGGAHSGNGGDGAGLVEADVAAEFEGFAVGEAGGVHFAAHSVEDDFGGAVVAIGAGLSEVGDAGVDEGRVEGIELGVSDAEAVGDAGAVVFDDDVGPGGEAGDDAGGGGVFEVDDDAALVGIEVEEEGAFFGVRFVVGEGAEAAGAVAGGGLDFDGISAVVGEEFGAVGAGDVMGEVEDFEAGEGAVGHSAIL